MASGAEPQCVRCGLKVTPEGHDPCLGTMEGVQNACCGHGEDNTAYIQYPDSTGLWSGEAIQEFDRLKIGPYYVSSQQDA